MDITTKLNDLMNDLRKGRTNLIAQGVDVSNTAGFSEVMDKILEIPSGVQSVGTVIDNSISVFKQVPVNSISHCYISSLGGYTHEVPDDSTILAPIRLENAKPMGLKVHGANLIDFEAVLKKWAVPYTKNGDSFTVTSGFSNGFSRPYKFTDNAQICTISATSASSRNFSGARLDIGYLDENGVFTGFGSIWANGENISCASTSKVNAMRLNYGGTTGSPLSMTFNELRINYGAVDCGYTPYKAPVEIPLPESITSLTNLGLGIYDNEYNEVDLVNGKYYSRCSTKTLVGTESFSYSKLGSRSRFNTTAPTNARYWQGNTLSRLKCDYLNCDATVNAINGNDTLKNKVQQWQTGWFFYVDGTDFPDLATWQAFLAEHNMEVVYELEQESVKDLDMGGFNPLIEVEGGGSIEFITDSGYAPNSTVVFQTIM